MNKNRFYIFCAIIFPILYGFFIIKNFSTPLSSFNGGDVEEWEYVGYFLSENIHFNPLPHLELVHNQTFYPFGTKQVFLDWSLESNYWYAFFYKNFGYGAWLNFYLVLSLTISLLGSYVILKKDFGETKSFIAGLMVTFFNVYALAKYPVHFPHSTIHWTILSIFTDFIIFRRFYFYENISLKWILLKIFLLVAVLGLNVGYIAGYALSSFTITFIVFSVLISFDFRRRKKQIFDYFSGWKTEFNQQTTKYFFLTIPIFIYLYFLLPLILQIYFEAKSFNIDTTHMNSFWSHPLRLFLPYFGSWNAIYVPLQHILHDMPEGESAGSVGWTCLFLGILGFVSGYKKNWVVFIPLIVFLVLSVLYHPNKFPTLKIFPWFEFNRVGSRFTSIIPVVFACFFLTIQPEIKFKKILITVLLLLFSLESFSIFAFFHAKKTYFLSEEVLKYMKVVEKQKGEAVFDFPFCIVGGDGSGLNENLCSVYEKTCGVYAYRRFHHKKVIGGYYSHIPAGELSSFQKIGLNKLFYGNGDWLSAKKVKNDFNEEQLAYFIRFVQLNDFCGINIYRDLISDELYKNIIKRIGKPKVITNIAGAGRVEFIPKPNDWYKLVDKQKAIHLKFPCGCD